MVEPRNENLSAESKINPPRLRSHPGPMPKILLIDDESIFLDACNIIASRYYSDAVHLLTMNPRNSEDILIWISEYLKSGNLIDAIYIDRNMPSIDIGNLIKNIKEKIEGAQYIPIAIMTVHPQDVDEEEYLNLGAFGFLYKSSIMSGKDSGQAVFLHQAIWNVRPMLDQMEDQRWVDLITEASLQLSKRPSEVRNILRSSAKLLMEHFGVCACYVRELDDSNSLRRLTDEDPFDAGDSLRIDEVPFIRELMDPESGITTRLIDTIGEAEGGLGCPSYPIKGYRLLAASLVHAKERFGTITLYRKPDAQRFRRKDEHFLSHFALQAAAAFAELRLRLVQTSLAEFVNDSTAAITARDIAGRLVKYLHTHIQRNDDLHAKTTARLIPAGTTDLPRIGKPLGLPADTVDEVKGINDDRSTYACVIQTGESQIIGDTKTQQTVPFLRTNKKTRSCLTVPLLAGRHCLGAVNMENTAPHYYQKSDRELAEALCRVTANVLATLRAQEFLQELLDLARDLAEKDKSSDELLKDAFTVLQKFTGYGRLLYMVPSEDKDELCNIAWRVVQVLNHDGIETDEEQLEMWRKHISKDWGRSFAKRSLANTKEYVTSTSDPNQFLPDEKVGFPTKFQAVVKLRSEANIRNDGRNSSNEQLGLIELLFPVKNALDSAELKLLERFGLFVGELLRQRSEARFMFSELRISRQEAMLGQVLGQFQHRLKQRLGIIGLYIERITKERGGSTETERVREILRALEVELASAHFWVKQPEFETVDVDEIWKKIVSFNRDIAESKGIVVSEFVDGKTTLWRTDEGVLRDTLFNLLQNALDACRSDDVIDIFTREKDDFLEIFVRDTGQGVPLGVRGRLFEPGFTTKPLGTGFGLYMSEYRIRELGGKLFLVESSNGEGACFCVRLPRKINRESGVGR